MTNDPQPTRFVPNEFCDDFWYGCGLDWAPDVTEELIEYNEKSLQVKLPQEYLKLLKRLNGGEPHPVAFRLPKRANKHSHVETIHTLGSIYGLADPVEHSRTHLLTGTRIDYLQRPVEDLVEFAYGGLASQVLCFDYRKRGRREEPEIVLVDFDYEPDPIYPIADDFGSFLQVLFNGRGDDCYGIAGKREDRDLLIDRFKQLDEWTRFIVHNDGSRGFFATHYKWRNKSKWPDLITSAIMSFRSSCDTLGYRDFPRKPEFYWVAYCNVDPVWREDVRRLLDGTELEYCLLHEVDWSLWVE